VITVSDTRHKDLFFPPHDILIPAVIQLLLLHLCDWKTNLIIPQEDTMKIVEHTINFISIKHRLP